MGKLDELKDKAKDMVTENRDRIEDGLEKAGNMINEKTGGKHADKIDKGLAKAQEGLDRAEGKADTGENSAGENAPATTPPPMPTQPSGPLTG